MKKHIILFATLSALLVSVFALQPSYAQLGGQEPVENGAEAARSPEQPDTLFGSSGTVSTITNVMLYIVGAIAVIMIVFGGLRYVISGGNSTQITAAKNTILYAVVGLIIALMAYAIINFVLGSFTGGGGGGSGGTTL